MRFIYLRNVFYGNILYNNIFLNNSFNIKLSDFAGFAINDYPPLVYYKTSHELPSKDILTRTKLFTLSFITYKIITSSKLYKDLLNHEVLATFLKGYYLNLKFVFTFKNTIIRY
jgi:hypothetical protein